MYDELNMNVIEKQHEILLVKYSRILHGKGIIMINNISKQVIKDFKSARTFELVFEVLYRIFRGKRRIIEDFVDHFFGYLYRLNYKEYLKVYYIDRVISNYGERYKKQVNEIIK